MPDAFVPWFGFRLEVWLVDGRTLLYAREWRVRGGDA